MATCKTVTVVLSGISGAGKSALFHNLFGEPVQKILYTDRDTQEPELKSVKKIIKGTKDEPDKCIEVRVIDTQGLVVNRNPNKTLKYMKKQIKEKYQIDHFDLLVFCIPARVGARLDRDQKLAMKSIQDFHGKEIWNRCMVVFTFSNQILKKIIKEADKKVQIQIFQSKLDDLMAEFRAELRMMGANIEELNPQTIFNWSRKPIENRILGIPAGFRKEDKVLPGIELRPGEGWADEIILQLTKKAFSLPDPQSVPTGFAKLRAGIGAGVGAAIAWVTGEKSPTLEEVLNDTAINSTTVKQSNESPPNNNIAKTSTLNQSENVKHEVSENASTVAKQTKESPATGSSTLNQRENVKYGVLGDAAITSTMAEQSKESQYNTTPKNDQREKVKHADLNDTTITSTMTKESKESPPTNTARTSTLDQRGNLKYQGFGDAAITSESRPNHTSIVHKKEKGLTTEHKVLDDAAITKQNEDRPLNNRPSNTARTGTVQPKEKGPTTEHGVLGNAAITKHSTVKTSTVHQKEKGSTTEHEVLDDAAITKPSVDRPPSNQLNKTASTVQKGPTNEHEVLDGANSTKQSEDRPLVRARTLDQREQSSIIKHEVIGDAATTSTTLKRSDENPSNNNAAKTDCQDENSAIDHDATITTTMVKRREESSPNNAVRTSTLDKEERSQIELNDGATSSMEQTTSKGSPTTASKQHSRAVDVGEKGPHDSSHENSEMHEERIPSKTTTAHTIQEMKRKAATRRKKFIKELKRAIDKDGKIDRKLAQIMFIGPTGSGKTSLMYRLIKRKKRKIASSTGVSDSIIPIDGFYAVTATDKTNWEEVEYDASLLRQLEADEDSGELRIKYKNTLKKSTANNPSDIAPTESPQQSTMTHDSTRQQSLAPPARPDYGSMVEIVMESYGGFSKFKKFFTKSYSLYMRDTGGQIEFQEMVSLLVFGPSLFILVFRAYQKLKEKFVVEYRKSDSESINSYTSSITMEEALLQSLASVYAMETSGGASILTHKARVLLVATHKDKLQGNADEQIKKLNNELQLLLTRSGFQDLVLYADKEKQQITFVVDNTADDDDSDFETIRSRIHALISDRIEFNIEYPVSYLLFSLELQNEKRSTIKIEEFYSMAAKYGITGNQVEHLLHFLHLRIGVIQYYDIDGVRHIVIKEPQVLFNAVTNIIVGTFRGDTIGEAREIENGIMSKSMLQTMISRNSIETPEEFMKLLVHLRIAAPFTMPGKQEQYFLPCVLNHVPESTENQVESEVMPLAIKFKCQHSPKGLFGVLVTHLMAPDPDISPEGTTFTLLPNKLSKDQVSFKVDSCGVCDEITLKFQSTYISISFFPEESTNRDTPKKVVCNNIRKIVHDFVRKSVRNLHYDQERVKPIMCLQCDYCCELHEVKKGKTHQKQFCKTKRISSRIPTRGRYWYNEDGDEKVPDTNVHTSTPEALTDKNFARITEYLRPLLNEEVIDIGTKLGLTYIHLKNAQQESLHHNMVHAWLRMDDDVKKTSGQPTWKSLLKALVETGHAGIALNIAEENNLPMPQQEKKEITPPFTGKMPHLGTAKNTLKYFMLPLLFILSAFVVSYLFSN